VFGYRARIGYTAPVAAVEVFPYEFYRMVPAGVTLAVATIPRWRAEPDDVEQTFRRSEVAVRELAEAGVSVIVVGGASPGYAYGVDRLDQMMATVTHEFGIPVTSALAAQRRALRAVGAQRLGVVTPFAAEADREFARLTEGGFEVVGIRGAGYRHADFGQAPTDAPAQVARELAAACPTADTIFFPAAHWPAASNVEVLEQELGCKVIASAQAIVWDALRHAGVTDSIAGFGRLLREH